MEEVRMHTVLGTASVSSFRLSPAGILLIGSSCRVFALQPLGRDPSLTERHSVISWK